MQLSTPAYDRRRFLRLAAGFPTAAMLAGCGSGGEQESDAVTVVTAPVAATPAVTATASHPLNLALMLAYLGGQYYGYSARGTGLPSDLTGGIGRAGAASGARQATFTDMTIAAFAAELADDKKANVVNLRDRIGVSTAAQPAIDLSVATASAFSAAAQRAGIVASGQPFDPYASDRNFLIGGFLVENMVAATYRTLLLTETDEASAAVTGAALAEAIYHGGLIRALLNDRAAADSAVDPALNKVVAMLATLDGTNVGDQTLASGSGTSSNILDADGRPIPFTRATTQVLNALYLSTDGVGGFLPMGANGIA